MSNASVALLFAIAAVAAGPGAPRVVKFTDGSASIDAEGGVDHVVVRDTKGNVTSESRCGAGTFDKYFALFTKLNDAVARADRAAIVNLIAYPLRVNGKKPLAFRNAAALTNNYDKVFTAEVQAKIRKAEPAAVFCWDGRAMLGDGVVWATGKGVVILNP